MAIIQYDEDYYRRLDAEMDKVVPDILSRFREAVRRLPARASEECESGWLIERYMHSVLNYWTGDVFGRGESDRLYFDRGALDSGFNADPNKALRFARAYDATIILARLLDGNGRVAEHIWPGAQSQDKP